MKFDLASLARRSLMALGVLGAMAVPSLAGPANLAASADIAAPAALKPIPVQSTEPDQRGGRDYSGNWRGQWEERDWIRRKKFRNHRRWDNDWRPRRHWDDDWYPRRHYRPRSGIYFNFDLEPRRIEPRYIQPRRVYRSGGSAHVRWCHNRYRSYRAWDNTFQPYYGPRQQCISPYI